MHELNMLGFKMKLYNFVKRLCVNYIHTPSTNYAITILLIVLFKLGFSIASVNLPQHSNLYFKNDFKIVKI